MLHRNHCGHLSGDSSIPSTTLTIKAYDGSIRVTEDIEVCRDCAVGWMGDYLYLPSKHAVRAWEAGKVSYEEIW